MNKEDIYKDRGLAKAFGLIYEGALKVAIIKLAAKLKAKGFILTSYQVSDRGSNYFDRKWAVYKMGEERPKYVKECLYMSALFPNVLRKKTSNCGAYKELIKFEKQLSKEGIIK